MREVTLRSIRRFLSAPVQRTGAFSFVGVQHGQDRSWPVAASLLPVGYALPASNSDSLRIYAGVVGMRRAHSPEKYFLPIPISRSALRGAGFNGWRPPGTGVRGQGRPSGRASRRAIIRKFKLIHPHPSAYPHSLVRPPHLSFDLPVFQTANASAGCAGPTRHAAPVARPIAYPVIQRQHTEAFA